MRLFPRLASSVLLWAIALGIIFSGYELGFFLLIGALGLCALGEYYTMLKRAGQPSFGATGLFCGLLIFCGSFAYYRRYGPAQAYDFEMSVLLFFLLVVFGRQMFERTRHAAPLATMAFTLFGLLWIIWLFNFVTKIVYVVPGAGQFYVLYLVVVTKFADMGAYLVGSLCGRHLLIPHVSPKKTWEGLAGALLFALGGSELMLWLMPERLQVLNAAHGAALGLLLGLAAIIGDLAESVVKRSAGAKDSGGLLPGIGGALDLIDSLLFTAPLLFLYLRLMQLTPLGR